MAHGCYLSMSVSVRGVTTAGSVRGSRPGVPVNRLRPQAGHRELRSSVWRRTKRQKCPRGGLQSLCRLQPNGCLGVVPNAWPVTLAMDHQLGRKRICHFMRQPLAFSGIIKVSKGVLVLRTISTLTKNVLICRLLSGICQPEA